MGEGGEIIYYQGLDYNNSTEGMIFTAHDQSFAATLVANGQQWMRYASTVQIYSKSCCRCNCSRGVAYSIYSAIFLCRKVSILSVDGSGLLYCIDSLNVPLQIYL